MRFFILIGFCLGVFSVAFSYDFYSVNESLLNADQLSKVKQNAFIELSSNEESIEAIYFLALVTIKETSASDPSKIYASNNYTVKFQKLYRDHAKAKGMMYGEQIMLSDVRFMRLFYYLGLMHFSLNDYFAAAEWLNLAEVGYEEGFDFNYYSGCSNYAIKNYEKAKKYFNAALKINPKHATSLYNVACIYSVKGEAKESVQWLRRAIEADTALRDIAREDSDFENIHMNQQYQLLMAN